MRLRYLTLLASFAAALCAAASAKPSQWTDAQGQSFKAEPSETLGAFAIFRQSATSGKRVLLRGLPPADCVRFYQETAEHPARADDLTRSTAPITRDLVGNTLTLQNRVLAPAPLAGRPEPAIYVLLFGSHNDGESWLMIANFMPTHRRLQAAYPGFVETVFFGVRHDSKQHASIVTQAGMPWLVADFDAQARMSAINRFAPAEGILMVAVNRDGVPLVSSRARDIPAVTRFIDELNQFVELAQPLGTSSWRDRAHYAQAVRPVQYAHGFAPPALIMNPFRLDALRAAGIRRLDATVDIGADGKATAARIDPAAGLPAALIGDFEKGLVANARYAPAVRDGAPVAAPYQFSLVVPEKEMITAAERAWIENAGAPVQPIANWLVLGPVQVDEQAFSTEATLDANGVYVMKALEVAGNGVSKAAQMGAFNSDWFTDKGGPASVQPKAGDVVEIEGKALAWRLVKSDDGYVDLHGALRHDYCIGYAYAEIEVDRPTQAYLGIGSDDGLKIWCNGEPVADSWIRRLSRVDDDIVSLKLRPGKNRILLKVQNAVGDWSFYTRLRVLAR